MTQALQWKAVKSTNRTQKAHGFYLLFNISYLCWISGAPRESCVPGKGIVSANTLFLLQPCMLSSCQYGTKWLVIWSALF